MAEKSADKQPKNSATGRPFKPGQSGNPKGRPKKGSAMADILNELTEDGDNRVIMKKVVTLAKQGVPWAVHFYADRTEGKALERILKKETHDDIEIL